MLCPIAPSRIHTLPYPLVRVGHSKPLHVAEVLAVQIGTLGQMTNSAQMKVAMPASEASGGLDGRYALAL